MNTDRTVGQPACQLPGSMGVPNRSPHLILLAPRTYPRSERVLLAWPSQFEGNNPCQEGRGINLADHTFNVA